MGRICLSGRAESRKFRLTYARAVTHTVGMENKNPEPLVTTRGWHHSLAAAEAVRARVVAALILRSSAKEGKTDER